MKMITSRRAGRARNTICFFMLLLLGGFLKPVERGRDDPWGKWLKEVNPIITRMEKSVAKMLKTTEERQRFKELFWRSRDPDPATPANEYRTEYYRRLSYAEQRLGGVKTDRGRIYILLGKPFNIENYAGYEQFVDCEMWSYRTDGSHGLFPFMNIVFFKPRDMGDYQLYHPGIHKPSDILSPYYSANIRSDAQAYKEIKKNDSVLAQASLSILPSEGNLDMGMSLSSSSFALNRIYTLPEREMDSTYIRNFGKPRVDVSYSTKAIKGFAYLSLNRDRGMTFLNYALLPDVLSLKHLGGDVYGADIRIHLTLEDKTGKQIYQHQQKIDLKVDLEKKTKIENQKIMFTHFVPVIPGEFNVTLTFMNQDSQEFFSHHQAITVTGNEVNALSGYKLNPYPDDSLLPFAVGQTVALTDPRSTFSQKESLNGMVLSARKPEVMLKRVDPDKQEIIPIESVPTGEIHTFNLSLSAVADGHYILSITVPGLVDFNRPIQILPFYIGWNRPVVVAKPLPSQAISQLRYILAQQFINLGKAAKAIDIFQQIPRKYWNKGMVPLVAQAYFRNGDYRQVVELLQGREIKKEYALLQMLANSYIELKDYPHTIECLKQLQQYGDTAELNNLLAAAYLSIGERKRAREHYEKAKKLMEK